MNTPTMPSMTTSEVYRSVIGDQVHYIGMVVGGDAEDPLTPKACQTATVTETCDDPHRLGLVVFAPHTFLLRPLSDGGADHDQVTLPKIEPGPSGRVVGTWHFPGQCG